MDMIAKRDLREFGYTSVAIEVNNTCNLKCTFCPLPIREATEGAMDKDKVLKLLEELSTYKKLNWVQFYLYNEPLMNKDIWTYVDYCRELELPCWLSTNGELLTKKNVDRILAHPHDLFRISLQVLNPETHNEIKQTKMPFSKFVNRVAEGLARLIDEKPDIREIRTDLAIYVDNYSGFSKYKNDALLKLGVKEHGDPTVYQCVRKHYEEVVGSGVVHRRVEEQALETLLLSELPSEADVGLR